MKEFEYFVKKKDVKRQSPDKNLSKATLRESEDRISMVSSLKNRLKPKYVLENSYEAMREAADAVLYAEGYKSYSHQASIARLSHYGFSDPDLTAFDRFRRLRNSIKYYGGDCEESDAEQAIQLSKKIIQRVKTILK